MALRITLNPYEKIIIAGAVIINGNAATHFIVDNKVPILREKDILKEEDAQTPASRIYFAIQLMYMDPGNLTNYHKLYWELVTDFVKAAPTTLKLIDGISEQILGSRYYQALKLARKLIEREQSLIGAIANGPKPTHN